MSELIEAIEREEKAVKKQIRDNNTKIEVLRAKNELLNDNLLTLNEFKDKAVQ